MMSISLSLILILTLANVESGPSPGCGTSLPEQPHPGRHHRVEVSVGEMTRSYIIHLPALYHTSNTSPTPLMMVHLRLS